MSTKHTPGPWGVEYDNADYNGGGQWYNAGPAKVWFPYNVRKREEDEAHANARLIAAAPELLEALQDLVDAMTGRIDGEATAMHNALAVIAKATGAPV